MAEQQAKENERKKLDQELLRQRIAQDQKFYANEMQKQKKRACEAEDMQRFHKAQMASIMYYYVRLIFKLLPRLRELRERKQIKWMRKVIGNRMWIYWK